MTDSPPQDPTPFLTAMQARHAAEQAKHQRDEHHRPLVFPAPEPRLSVAERGTIRWAYHRTNGCVATVRELRGAQLALLVRNALGDERCYCLVGLKSRAPEAAVETFRRVAERGGTVLAAYDVKEQHALRVETNGGAPHFLRDDDPHALAPHLLVHEGESSS